jgi:putative ABC transport system permease protein
MIGYYFRLALASFRRTPGLTALMVLAVGIGIGVCVVTLTIYQAMSGHPIWWKNDQLYAVTLDNWDPNEPADDERPHLPPDQLTFKDAEALWRSDIPKHTAIMFRSAGVVSGQGLNGAFEPLEAVTRVTTAGFFPMFEVPFKYGTGWSNKADAGPEPVIVLSKKLNDKIFGGQNSVGRTIRWSDIEFRIVGVLDEYQPQPKYYDLNNGAFDAPEDAYIPWRWGANLQLRSYGNSNCWNLEDDIGTFEGFMRSDCVWVQAWVELPTLASRYRMQSMLDAYTDNERKAGRFQRPRNNRLTDVAQWLEDQRVVQSDNRVLVGLAFAFLAVCLINTIGLLLAKFLNGAAISGVRRALGASRRDLFTQHMVEVSAVSIAGAVLGLALGALGLAGIRQLYAVSAVFVGNAGYRSLAHMDVSSYVTAVALAVVATCIAGLYPAWRVGRLQPAVYLKNQ